MVQALLLQRIAQRAHDMLLAHHLLEAARPVLAGEHDIGHALHSTGGPCLTKDPTMGHGRMQGTAG